MLYHHIRHTRPRMALELGTARGVSAAYIAGAMEANGAGELVTVDSALYARREPAPEEVLERIGLSRRVTLDRRYSTYTWFLKEELARRCDPDGNCDPAYDFCFLDGAKNWTVDGLAVLLVERLLRPGGWLLLDDLEWRYADRPRRRRSHYSLELDALTDAEREEPHIRAVFDLIIRPHPAFTELRIVDDWWAWARKAPGEPRRLRIETSRSAPALALAALRRFRRTRPGERPGHAGRGG